MQTPQSSVMAFKSYKHKAKILVRDYLLAESFIPYTSVLGGIFMSKMVYDLIQLLSSSYFKGYSSLTKPQRIEWNNRGMSSVHAIFISVISIYLVFFSDLFSDNLQGKLIIFQSSHLSTFALGVSVGYFITDLTMMFWAYPILGGSEYVFHHVISVIAVAYSMYSGEGQLYTCLVLISEATTPSVNLRWFLDTAGMKRSNVYLVNGAILFLGWLTLNINFLQLFTNSYSNQLWGAAVLAATIWKTSWLVARILLFFYLFRHVFLHYEQIMEMHIYGHILVFGVPFALAIMNTIWFAKILKGMKKTWVNSSRRI